MENQVIAVVPSKERKIVIATKKGNKQFPRPERVVEFFQTIQGQETTILGMMGGPGQSLFVRAADFGFSVWRIPMYRLQELTSILPKATAYERAEAIQRAWQNKPEFFYRMASLERTIGLIRQLTRVRLGIQDIFRKPAQLQYQAALRDLSILLPEGEELLRLKTFFANPRFIEGAEKDEEELESKINSLVKVLPIWTWIHPSPESGLPGIKGFGPAVGGSVVSEIGDIRRFPSREDLRAYARFHLIEGKFPKRTAGEISPWNRYLNRALWWWSTDQVARYEHPWRMLYYWKKAKEMQVHPEVQPREVRDRQGRPRTIYDFTLKHLDMRAKRWVGSQLLNYLWDLWQIVEKGDDSELWYSNSSWPAYFARVEQELQAGLLEYLEKEIPKRRRREPKGEKEEEEGKEEEF